MGASRAARRRGKLVFIGLVQLGFVRFRFVRFRFVQFRFVQFRFGLLAPPATAGPDCPTGPHGAVGWIEIRHSSVTRQRFDQFVFERQRDLERNH